MKTPRVIISIPTYNQELNIKQAIDSALMQTYPNIQINVCDDCSKDSTWEICQKYKNNAKVFLYRNETNIGRVKTYQRLFYELGKNAEWIINLDGDDFFIDNDFIRKAMHLILDHPLSNDIVLYHYQYDVFPFRKKTALGKNVFLIDGADYVIRRPLVKSFFHLGAIVRRDMALKTNFYRYQSLNTDALSIQELALKGKVIIDLKEVGHWSLNENSETRKAVSPDELELYKIANQQFLVMLGKNLANNQLDEYHKNLNIINTKEEVISIFKKRQFIKAIKGLIGCPAVLLYFYKEIIKSILNIE